MFGLTQKDLDLVKRILKEQLSVNSAVFVFGSRARGVQGKFSDIDIMVESKVTNLELARTKEQFEESDLSIKVDLIHISDFANDYLKNYESEKIKLDLS
jgi:predicted nucleotidyltransferase